MATEAKIALTAEDKTRAAFESVKGNLQGLHSSAVAVTGALSAMAGGLAVAKLMTDVKGVIDQLDELGKAAQRAGFQSAQSMGEFQYAAKLAGVDAAGFESAMGKLAGKMADAAGGSKEAAAVFQALGLRIRDSAGQMRSTESVLTELAAKFATFQEGPLKSALAVDVFGKSGKELIPLLNGGAEGLEDLRKEFQQLHGIIDEKATKSAEQFNDNLTKLQLSSGQLGRDLASAFLPSLVRVTEQMVLAAKEGGFLKGVLAGIQTLLTGDDRHKANEEIVKGTERLLQIENALDAIRSKGAQNQTAQDARTIANLTQERALLQDRVNLARSYGRELDAQQQKRDDGTKPGTAPPPIVPKTPGGAGAKDKESAYDKLNRSIMERLKLSAKELEQGRELTESERWAAKVLDDLSDAKMGATEAQRAVTTAYVESAKAQDVLVQRQRAQERDAAAAAKAWDDEQKAIADFAEKQRKRDIERLDLGKKTLEQIEFETSLIGLNAEERERALIMRELETKGIKEGTEAWEKYGRSILDAVGNRSRLQQQADAMKDMWESIDRTAHDVWTNIFDGGTNVFKKLGQTLKASVLDVLYQMTVRRWVISIGASMGVPGAAQAAQAFGGGSNMLGGLSSMLGGVGGNFGAGLGAGISGLFGEAGLMGTLDAGFTALGAGNIMGGLGTLAGPIGIALTAIALLSKSFKGETRSGGQYNFGNLISGPSGGEVGVGSSSAGAAAGTTAQAINALLAGMGSSSRLTNFMTGLETSEKGKGFAYAGGTLSTGKAFGQGWGDAFATPGYMNRRGDMTPEQAVTAFGEELKQATLQALQAATGVPEAVARLLRDKDFDAMAGDQLDAVLTQVQGVITGVEQFGAALIDLPFDSLRAQAFDLKAAFIDASGGVAQAIANLSGYTSNYLNEGEQRQVLAGNISRRLSAAGANFSTEQILGSSRAQFRQVVDAFSGRDDEASVRLLAALMDVQGMFAQLHPVVEETAAALNDVTGAHQQYLASLQDVGQGIWAFRRNLSVTQAGLASPEALLSNTRGAYLQDLGLARGGDLDASRRITDSAQAYIDAQKGYTASSGTTSAVIAQIIDELGSLPATQSYEQQMLTVSAAQLAALNDIKGNTANTVQAVGTLFYGLAGAVPSGLGTGTTGGSGGAAWGGSPVTAPPVLTNTSTGGASWGGSPTTTGPSISAALGGIDWADPAAATAQLAGYMRQYGWTAADVAGVYSWFSPADIAQHLKARGFADVVPGYARGGTAQGLAWVGEQGPELVHFGQPSRVYSAGQSAAMVGDSDARLGAIEGHLKALVALSGAGTNAQLQAAGGMLEHLATIAAALAINKARLGK